MFNVGFGHLLNYGVNYGKCFPLIGVESFLSSVQKVELGERFPPAIS